MIDEVIAKVKDVAGVDVIYFLKDSQIIKEHKNTSNENYLEQVQNLIKSESLLKSIGSNLLSDEFHTYSLLNEAGLMIVSKLSSQENLYMIIVAGENAPVDLLNLLKICKEARLSFNDHTVTNA